jgi:hypothetical protein
MAYNRGPYPPYDDTNPNQPYPVGYPQEIPYTAEEYIPQATYDGYNYPYPEQATFSPPDYRKDPKRDWARDYPRQEYDGNHKLNDVIVEMIQADYREATSERPRESWNERNDAVIPLPFKREEPRPQRRISLTSVSNEGHEPYRPRRPFPPRAPPPAQPSNPDPYTLDHIVPFNYFCDWYKQTNARTLSKNPDVSRDEMQESFIKYREDLLARTAKGFVKEHITEEWFKERYDPVLAPQIRAKQVNYRRWLYERFMEDLDAGQFDELTLDGAAGIRSNFLSDVSTALL